ncbi:MAG: SAM-dependent methyltransferase [Pseudomonadota bacterium]|nr:SAM-dependent methyltransferase [Pseudomonadota bacterium]
MTETPPPPTGSDTPAGDAGPLTDLICRQIRATGPLSVPEFMTLALQHPEHGYYRRQQAIGAAGDFVTAPEISQVFGELLGLWLVQRWIDLGQPGRVSLVELGPGRGTLMADALRAASAMPGFLPAVDLVLVETNPTLQALQAERLAAYNPRWVEALGTIEPEHPTLVLGNEFLDVLPTAQFAVVQGAWRERLVAVGEDGALGFVLGQPQTPVLPLLPPPAGGLFTELMPSLPGFFKDLSALLRPHGGAALFIDYAHDDRAAAWSLQAVREHEKVDPLATPGLADLTTLVDFDAASRFARGVGLSVPKPVSQRDFLLVLGAWQRFEVLAEAAPDDAPELLQSLQRLVGKSHMGERFKAWTCSFPETLPPPAGFPTAEAGPAED